MDSLSKSHAKKLLVDGGYVLEKTFDEVVKETEKENTPIIEAFIKRSLLTKDLYGQAVAEAEGVRYTDLNSKSPIPGWTNLISETIAKQYRVVLFKKDDDSKRVVVTTDALEKKKEITTEAQKLFPGYTIVITYSLSEDIEKMLRSFEAPFAVRLKEITQKENQRVSVSVNEIFEESVRENVSDIHFEPTANDVRIRFRVDGVLVSAGALSKEYYQSVVNRIKVLAGLRIDERSKTQDGSIRFTFEDGRPVDFRVSIAPTILGEKIVIRVLSKYVSHDTLEGLGFTEKQSALLNAAAQKPLGFMVVSGPTGSGKTTTLHTLLSLASTPEVNVTTIEDPVEYRLPSANQIQVNETQGISFAKGLRAIVRQDPDIILIGEIRDGETAEIAVNAALTGHRVFTTFHANSAAVSIPRLLDMGIEPFLLSSTLTVVAGQRLVRQLCTECRYSYRPTKKELEAVFNGASKLFESKANLYKAKGCDVCSGLGYKGRVSVAEVLEVTPEVRELIMQRADASAIEKQAVKNGMVPMFEAGLELVKNGETSLEELVRVVAPS